jgi:hypothetical protein
MWYTIFGFFIDTLFFFDIIVNFNSAYLTSLNEIEDNRKSIALNYFKSWFIIDTLAIIPFELITDIVNQSETDTENTPDNYNQFVRISRVSKLYKLVKITRLIRLIKIAK